ncbi:MULTISPECIES: hypothetical protein [Butyricimonas]|uniref:hypothetical protein n=1 Tax=Butyricimonas TaxID=574697 RepID=UPI001D09560A|nr:MULTISPECIES: hypothetical protein [Butyricimonas]MCB6973848.1 hypothetical protein [Butyricimonas synergistica]MCG4520658.1 hypothetical protein [Butyricimonas sp. DFI.6.44]
MKIFRRPFKKSGTAFDIKFALITFVLLWGFAAYTVGFTIRGILASIVFVFILVQLYISRLYYVILRDDKLIVQNGVYSFWRKEVRYVDIVKVKIKWWQDRTYPYMKIITRKSSGISWRYTIDLVDPQDYKALVEAIEAKGVTVEMKGIERNLS